MTRSFPRRLCQFVLFTSAILLTTSSASGQTSRKWGGEFRMQMAVGGDKVASVSYSDGSDSNLRLGTYFTFVAGPIYNAWSSGKQAVELQALVGFGSWSTGPENTDDRLALKRVPVELLAFYRFPIVKDNMFLRLGGGATYHFVGGIKGSGSLDDVNVGVSSAPGGVLEATFIQGIVSGGIRYTIMSNVLDGLGSMTASSVGGFLGISLPR